MAALRAGLHTVILPRENEKDLEEIDQSVRVRLRFVPVDSVDAVFAEALLLPEPRGSAGLDSYVDAPEKILAPALRI